MSITIGVDPGASGAIAILVDGELFDVYDMPYDLVAVGGKKRRVVNARHVDDIYRQARAHCAPYETPNVAIERVWARGSEGSVGAFAFGRSFEAVVSPALIAGWTVTLLPPQEWQAAVGGVNDKAHAVGKACAYWPQRAELFTGPKGGLKDGRADAALIGRARDIIARGGRKAAA